MKSETLKGSDQYFRCGDYRPRVPRHAATFGGDGRRSLPRYVCYLLLTLLSSGLKVALPGITGTMSVNFLFILSGMVELGSVETLGLGISSALVQIYWHAKKRPPLYQVLFNLAAIAIAIRFAQAAYNSSLATALGGSIPLRLLFATTAYFLGNTVPIASAISMTERRSLSRVWRECYVWAFPLLSDGIDAGVFPALGESESGLGVYTTGDAGGLGGLPLLSAVYRPVGTGEVACGGDERAAPPHD